MESEDLWDRNRNSSIYEFKTISHNWVLLTARIDYQRQLSLMDIRDDNGALLHVDGNLRYLLYPLNQNRIVSSIDAIMAWYIRRWYQTHLRRYHTLTPLAVTSIVAHKASKFLAFFTECLTESSNVFFKRGPDQHGKNSCPYLILEWSCMRSVFTSYQICNRLPFGFLEFNILQKLHLVSEKIGWFIYYFFKLSLNMPTV